MSEELRPELTPRIRPGCIAGLLMGITNLLKKNVAPPTSSYTLAQQKALLGEVARAAKRDLQQKDTLSIRF